MAVALAVAHMHHLQRRGALWWLRIALCGARSSAHRGVVLLVSLGRNGVAMEEGVDAVRDRCAVRGIGGVGGLAGAHAASPRSNISRDGPDDVAGEIAWRVRYQYVES